MFIHIKNIQSICLYIMYFSSQEIFQDNRKELFKRRSTVVIPKNDMKRGICFPFNLFCFENANVKYLILLTHLTISTLQIPSIQVLRSDVLIMKYVLRTMDFAFTERKRDTERERKDTQFIFRGDGEHIQQQN